MKANMKQTLTIPETFLGVGYTKDRAGLPLESVRVPVPRPRADQVLIRVAASSLNPLEYKLAELNFLGRTPPVILGLDLSGIVVATGSAVRGVAVGDINQNAYRGRASFRRCQYCRVIVPWTIHSRANCPSIHFLCRKRCYNLFSCIGG